MHPSSIKKTFVWGDVTPLMGHVALTKGNSNENHNEIPLSHHGCYGYSH